eukprot:3941758-Rhodomonas_salina.5
MALPGDGKTTRVAAESERDRGERVLPYPSPVPSVPYYPIPVPNVRVPYYFTTLSQYQVSRTTSASTKCLVAPYAVPLPCLA